VVVLAAAAHLVLMRVLTLDQQEQQTKVTLVVIPQGHPAIILLVAAVEPVEQA
jgi:hypothetical protein